MKIKNLGLRWIAIILFLALIESPGFTQTNDAEQKVEHMFSCARQNSKQLLQAARDVVAIGSTASPFIQNELVGREPNQIVWGLRCLRNLKDKSSETLVLSLLKHDKAEVRIEAILVAKHLFGPELAKVVFTLTTDKDLLVRRRSFDAAIELAPNDPRLIDLSFKALADGDFWLVSRAIRVIRKLKIQNESDKEMIRDRTLAIAAKLDRGTAKMIFGPFERILGPECLVIFERILDRGRNETKVVALESAGNLRMKVLLPQVRKLLGASNSALQIAAIRFVGELKDRQSASSLIGFLDDLPPGKGRTAAVIALRKISGRTIGFDSAEWRAWLESLPST